MTQNETTCMLNDSLKGLKSEYSKTIASQSKRIMFLLDERNFVPQLSLCADFEMLKTIFGVLVNNAIKHTDKGYIKIGYRILENNVLQFFVEDTGNGFEPEILETLNKLLVEDTGNAAETASNLTEVNRLVKAQNGKMRIESQKGMGATVYFSTDYNPVKVNGSDDNKTAENTALQQATPTTVKNSMNNIWAGRTILIAEDEIVNYMFLEVLFEETGAVLLHAADGQQAIDLVKTNPNINIVLMDIKMPNINGLDATRQIKAIRPQLPVIAQTAYAMQDDEYKALQAGCNDYISKPIDAMKLAGIMKKYI